MNCFVCEEEFELMTGFNDGDETGQAWHSNVFICHGGYGSTVFDPVHGNHFLRVTICDDCLTAKSRNGLVKVVTQTPRAPLIETLARLRRVEIIVENLATHLGVPFPPADPEGD